MAKYNIYAVAHGLDPKTKEPVSGLKFHSWDECKPYITGVEGAKFKGFLTEAEADVWLAKTAEVQTDKEDPIKKEAVKETGTGLLPDFVKTCEELGVVPESVALALQMQFVSQQKLLKTMKTTTESGLPFI